MLKCALALLVVAAAIDATQAAGHVAGKVTCDQACEDAFTAADTGRERRAGHAAAKTTCLATCQTDFDIADAKGKCDEVCQTAFDAVRSRRADHAFAQTLCNAKCTAAQDVSLAAQAAPVCGAVCQAKFDVAAAAATAAAGDRSRRAGHAAAQGTCDAGCATAHSTADKMACDNVCDAEFNRADDKATAAAAATAATAATAAAATAFCSTYDSTCGDDATATKFGADGATAGEMTAACEMWYKAADAGTADDTTGATRGCYEYHLTKAQEQGTDAGVASAATHCPHAKGDSECDAVRDRRAGHSVIQTACKATCTTTFDAEEAATAVALALTQPVEMTDLEKIVAFNDKMAEFVTAEDTAGLKAFIKSEAATKCTCADFADYDPTTDTATFCGTACFTQAAAEAASGGSFASSAAAVVIAGLAAALY